MHRNLTLCLVLLLSPACSDDGAIADAGVSSDAVRDTGVKPDLAAPHTITLFDRTRINSKGTTNLRQAEASFAFDKGPYAKLTLEVKLETSCFPFDKWTTPPAGQNWPADCDAFDRNFELHMDPATDTGDPPGMEWVRAITPFGGPMSYTLDLTDIANALPGKHQLRVVIPTYSDATGQITGSDGGWWVTAKLKAEPGAPPREVLAAVSLFNLTYKHDSGQQQVDVTVPAGTRSARVEYRVTGHGGVSVTDAACIGPAEEFCQRWHRIFVDGKEVQKIAPWRKDCDKLCTLATWGTRTYCKENPCGAISSVKAPRANWCPGSITPPYSWSFSELTKPGKHTFGFQIDSVAQGGQWQVSATYYAFK